MNQTQAQVILDYLDIIKHFAKGGQLEFHSTNWRGEPTKTRERVDKGIIINCLPHYRKIDEFVEVKKTKAYCSRWCPMKKTNQSCLNCKKENKMISAQEAREKLEKIRAAENEASKIIAKELMDEIGEAIEGAINCNEESLTYHAGLKYSGCISMVNDALHELGYKSCVSHERRIGASYVFTIEF